MKLKPLFKLSILSLSMLFLVACGGGSTGGGEAGGNDIDNPTPIKYGNNTTGIHQFGLGSDSSVYMYRLTTEGKQKTIHAFTQSTTTGTMQTAGRFNTHSSELDDETFYIYDIFNGTDLDPDHDGKKNSYAIPGREIKAVVKGVWLKQLKGKPFRVTPLLNYITLENKDAIKNYIGLEEALNKSAKEYLKSDINGDGEINMLDVITYNPITDRKHTKDSYNYSIRHWFSINNAISPIDLFYPKSAIKKYANEGGEILSNKQILSADKKHLYYVTKTGFYILDVSDSYHKAPLAGKIEMPFEDNLLAYSPMVLTKDRKHVLFIIAGKGLYVINVENPNTPRLVTLYTSHRGSNIKEYNSIVLSYNSKKAYLVSNIYNDTNENQRGIDILDISNLSKIHKVGTIDYTSTKEESADVILARSSKVGDDTKVYLWFSNNHLTNERVETYDITNPTHPKRLDSETTHNKQSNYLIRFIMEFFHNTDYRQVVKTKPLTYYPLIDINNGQLRIYKVNKEFTKAP